MSTCFTSATLQALMFTIYAALCWSQRCTRKELVSMQGNLCLATDAVDSHLNLGPARRHPEWASR